MIQLKSIKITLIISLLHNLPIFPDQFVIHLIIKNNCIDSDKKYKSGYDTFLVTFWFVINLSLLNIQLFQLSIKSDNHKLIILLSLIANNANYKHNY